MDIHEAIREPHDVTRGRLEAFSRFVGLEVDDDSTWSLPLSCIVRVGEGNTLRPLDHLGDRVGVYGFQLGGCVIYVGGSGWALRNRIPQHLRKGSGNTLWKNWERLEGGDFNAFETRMRECCMWTLSFPRDRDVQKIRQLEHLLIGILGPRYCDVPA